MPTSIELPPGDSERFDIVTKHLYTPVLGDILDELGRFHQFLPAEVRPLLSTMKVVGRAMPVLSRDTHGSTDKPFGRMTEALDQLHPGEVYLAAAARSHAAMWGEIMTAAARYRGATGAVVAGFHRDTFAVLEQDFPVFSRGSYALDSRPRLEVVDFRVRAEIGKVIISPGDLVVGDVDGVLVIPQDIEAEVLERALSKATQENSVRRLVESGVSSTDVLSREGIL